MSFEIKFIPIAHAKSLKGAPAHSPKDILTIHHSSFTIYH